jgi:hypothetical protein
LQNLIIHILRKNASLFFKVSEICLVRMPKP